MYHLDERMDTDDRWYHLIEWYSIEYNRIIYQDNVILIFVHLSEINFHLLQHIFMTPLISISSIIHTT